MRNLLLELFYDGTNYHGWQVQKNGISVQQTVQNVLLLLFHCPVDVTGCSRTDAGVHAHQFFCTARTESSFSSDRLVRALNGNLPRDIGCRSCREVAEGFHPRYDVLSKDYEYQIWNTQANNPFFAKYAYQYPRLLDIQALNSAAQCFEGMQDFAAFMSRGSKIKDTVRRVERCFFTRDGDMVTFHITADGFLYNMVRIIVGTLLEVSAGTIDPGQLPEILRSKDRDRAGFTAPALGLALHRVVYPAEKEADFHGQK